MNNNFVTVPEVSATATGSFYLTYYLRPNQLVSSDRIATITAINTSTGDVTVDVVPSVFSTGTPLDLVETKAGHRCLGIDLSATAINTSTRVISFGIGVLPASLAIGDNICLSGECYIPQIPDDLHSVLAQRVACRCLESMGDTAGLQNAMAKLMEMEKLAGTLIDNRTEGQPKKVNNLRSTLRFAKMSYRKTTI